MTLPQHAVELDEANRQRTMFVAWLVANGYAIVDDHGLTVAGNEAQEALVERSIDDHYQGVCDQCGRAAVELACGRMGDETFCMCSGGCPEG